MRLRRLLPVVTALVALATSAVVAPIAHADATHYYVALGDSLSRGYMPGLGDTDQGYVDDLYATLHATDPSLQLVKLGCSGETTGTMINGGKCTDRYPDAAHSQLATAEQFLRDHAGAVSYLTLDIGANDVDGCAPGGSIDLPCVAQGTATITQNLQTILDGLKAAGSGSAKSVGMTYYDPFLASWLSGTQGQVVALGSVTLLQAINTDESLLYAAHGFKIADVATAFQSLNFLGRQTVAPYGSLPTNVAYICKYTFMCSQQNIHANVAGYQLIANTFAAKLS
jgi:lysophospholipase L1-like esterase